MARSIFSRRADLAYLAFFLIHIPITLFADLVPLYPEAVLRALPFIGELRSWYIARYHDQFAINPPAWFLLFLWMEGLYHLPLSIWALGALIRDDPLVPVHLLAWSVQTAVTTAACIAEIVTWTQLTSMQRRELLQMYGPYCVVAALIAVDMFFRLRRKVLAVEGSGTGSGKARVKTQ